jgi:hypothetical protein
MNTHVEHLGAAQAAWQAAGFDYSRPDETSLPGTVKVLSGERRGREAFVDEALFAPAAVNLAAVPEGGLPTVLGQWLRDDHMRSILETALGDYGDRLPVIATELAHSARCRGAGVGVVAARVSVESPQGEFAVAVWDDGDPFDAEGLVGEALERGPMHPKGLDAAGSLRWAVLNTTATLSGSLTLMSGVQQVGVETTLEGDYHVVDKRTEGIPGNLALVRIPRAD